MHCIECNKQVKDRRSLEAHVKKAHNLKLREYELKHNLVKPVTCRGCSSEFIPIHAMTEFCTKECRKNRIELDKQKLLKTTGIKNIDYVICQWCGYIAPSLSINHIQSIHKDKSIEEYKKEFPEHNLISEKYKKSISINSGKFMKEEKYRKMYSERIKGNKNPNHRDNTTLEKRKETSPFSIEFHKKRNPNLTDKELKKLYSKNYKSYIKDRISNNQLEYWLNKGFSEKEAKKKLKDRQTTFSLKKCIERYGEEQGKIIWQARQDKWLNTMNSKSDEEKAEILKKKIFSDDNYSKVSQKLFWEIYDNIQTIIQTEKDLYFKELNNEYFLNFKNKDFFLADFKFKNKIIEFNGDYWHANPSLYDSEWVNCVRKMTAKQIWEKDQYKYDKINEKYELLVIWEKDFDENPEEVVKKCLEFLND